MIKRLIRLFALHHRCYWCEFPVPDCVCPVSRLSCRHTVANDNESVIREAV